MTESIFAISSTQRCKCALNNLRHGNDKPKFRNAQTKGKIPNVRAPETMIREETMRFHISILMKVCRSLLRISINPINSSYMAVRLIPTFSGGIKSLTVKPDMIASAVRTIDKM